MNLDKKEFSDFIAGYERALQSQGFVFNTFNEALGKVGDWSLSIEEFLFWVQQGWSVGSILVISPVSNVLEFENSALEAIAEKSIESNTNARGLRTTLEKLLIPYQFEAQELARKGLKKLVINGDSVNKKELPIFVFDNKKKEYGKKL